LADLWSREGVPLPEKLRGRHGDDAEYDASKVGMWLAQKQKVTFEIEGAEYTLERAPRTENGPGWSLVKQA
jgi:hypothetical protein